MPRTGRYGAGGKAWRHISQSGRVPPDRRSTDNIGSEDGGQPALQRRPPFTDKLAIKAGRIQPVQKMLECLLLARKTLSESVLAMAGTPLTPEIRIRASAFPDGSFRFTLGCGPYLVGAATGQSDPKPKLASPMTNAPTFDNADLGDLVKV